MKITKFLSGTAWLAMLALPCTVQAQTEEGTDDAESQDNVIIVTGQKIERSLQDTVASVSITTAEEIQEQNFQDVYDIIGQTANVASLFDGAGFSIRGLRNTGASGEAQSDVASIYVDGVFIPSSLLTNGAFSLWDAQSVEIFRGPQSTIQGRNALAGAIVVRTRDPGDDFSGDFQAEAAEFNSYRASGAVTAPIVPGQLSLRVAGDYQISDGFQNNVFLDRDDIDESEAITARGTLLFTPDFAPRFSARLGFTYTDKTEGENRVVEAFFPDQRISNQNLIDRQGAEAYIASAELNYDITDDITLTSVTGYIDSNSFFNFDSDSNNPITSPLAPGIDDVLQITLSEDEIFTQELRLTWQTDNFAGLLGGYFFDNSGSTGNDNSTVVGTDFAFPDPNTLAFLVFGDVNPTTVAQATALRQQIVTLVPSFPVQLVRQGSTEIRNYAIFGEGTINLTSKLKLTLGARYDIESVDQTVFDQVAVPTITTGVALIDQILAATTAQFNSTLDLTATNDFEAFLPKVAVSYDISDDVTIGASYQRAYRAGALSFNTFRGALAPPGSDQAALEDLGIVNSFDPEFTNNYELSFRSQWLDGALTVNANAYYIDYTDQQVTVQLSSNPLDTLTDNVGASRLLGFELETSIRPAAGLDLYLNLGVSDTKFTEGADIVGGTNLTGFEFLYAPDITVGFGGRYEHPSGFYGNLRSRLTDESFSTLTNEIDGIQDSAFVVDLAFGWQNDNFGVELFARNILDEKYLTFNPGFNERAPNGAIIPEPSTTAIAGAPQVFGIRLRGGF